MKHVLITGANRGIGLGLAEVYARAGSSVFGVVRTPLETVDQVAWMKGDVTDLSSLRQLEPKLPELDLLVCNAGIYLDREVNAFQLEDQSWAETFAANVEGVFRTVQAFERKLKKGSKIAIIASQMGSSERANGGSYIYRASKAAAANLGRNLAVDFAERGVSVGIYHPGWVRTEMGTDEAAIDVKTSVAGLMERFEALGPETTGCFESYDGSRMPF